MNQGAPHPNPAASRLGTQALDALMPMHLRVAASGHILSVGPTIAKMRDPETIVGARFLEVFELRRPIQITEFRQLVSHGTSILRAKFRDGHPLTLKGVIVPLMDEVRLTDAGPVAAHKPHGSSGALINLSLGASIVDAVKRYSLSGADFAASDPTVDMLYLIEAKTIALEESKRLNSRLESARDSAVEKAFTDTLTGLKNRRGMNAVLSQLEQSRTRFGLMHLDLDHFKQVNDTYGHAAGDHVLRQVADVLQDETRKEDIVARVGGDEFVLIFRDCVDLSVLEGIAHRIIARLEQPVEYEGATCRVSASIGTTLSTFYEQPEADQMLSDADRALYVSKDQGRACHTVFRPDATRAS